MSHYKPYPKYKNSGVEWIGNIPAHWSLVPIKRAVLLDRVRATEAPEGSTYIGLEDVEAETGRYIPSEATSRESEGSTVGVFSKGDVLYGKLRPYLRKSIVAEMNGVCSTEFLILKAEDVTGRWLQRWLLTPDASQQIEAGCEGAKMPRADWEHVGSVPLTVPPLAEQNAISSALGKSLGRIDALVAKKTLFVELLHEKRRALVAHAVTKGIDPNVRTKESGVEWMGRIPSHWDVVQSRRLFSERNEKADPGEVLMTVSQKYGVIPQAEYMALEGRRVVEISKGADSVIRVLPNDFVISLRSFQGGIEWCCVRGSVTFHYVPIHAVKWVYEPFFAYLFKSSTYIQALRTTTNLIRDGQDMRYSHFIQVPLPVVPIEEQKTIAEFLAKATSKIDYLIEKTSKSAALLSERRSALITAAVTGQIDLREVA